MYSIYNIMCILSILIQLQWMLNYTRLLDNMDLLSIVTVEYTSVASHDIIKKMEVAAALQTTQQPSITSLSKLCKVSRTFMRKIFSELVQHGNLVPPDQKRQHTESGPY